MSKNRFEYIFQSLLEKHIPVYFMNYTSIQKTINSICKRKNINRREILILSYIIGASSEECNKLLESKGHNSLYVREREDAIWKFALDNHMDCETVVKKIFLQNVENKNE